MPLQTFLRYAEALDPQVTKDKDQSDKESKK